MQKFQISNIFFNFREHKNNAGIGIEKGLFLTWI